MWQEEWETLAILGEISLKGTWGIQHEHVQTNLFSICKLQKCIALSTTEVECIAFNEGGKNSYGWRSYMNLD